MPQKTRVGNDRSQSTTHVARRRNRNEKLYKAGARSSVTLAAQNADRRAAVSEIELALSTRNGHGLPKRCMCPAMCTLIANSASSLIRDIDALAKAASVEFTSHALHF